MDADLPTLALLAGEREGQERRVCHETYHVTSPYYSVLLPLVDELL